MSAPNINTQHQTWGRWTFIAHANPPSFATVPFDVVKANCARFFGLLTRGGAAMLNVEQTALPTTPGVIRYIITLRWDNRQALDPGFQAEVGKRVGKFFYDGLGPTATVHLKPVVVEAGDAEDGKPPAQLLIVPHLASTTRMGLGG